jgi:hypothetical protein
MWSPRLDSIVQVSCRGAPSDDRDGAVGVLEHGLADRSENHPGEATPAPGADHDQARVGRFDDQGVARVTAHDPAVDAHLGEVSALALDHVGELCLLHVVDRR